MSNVLGLFPIPLFLDEIIVSDEIREYVKTIPYTDKANGHVSVDSYILNNDIFKNLRKELLDKFNEYTNEVLNVNNDDIRFELNNSWIFRMDPGDHGAQHQHANSLITGVLYLETHENCGNIVFHKNYENLFPELIQIDFKNYNMFNSKTWFMKPSNNMIMFFPSNLPHRVERNESNKSRYSLAFNFFPKGKFGFNTRYGLDKLTLE